MRRLCHASAHEFRAQVGQEIVLRPGTQNAQGVGVYFAEGVPDVRASDSCEAHGVKTIFHVDFQCATRNSDWFQSKGCRDRAKSRPRTWHSNGRQVRIVVTAVDGIHVYGVGERV